MKFLGVVGVFLGWVGFLQAREPFSPSEFTYKNSEAFQPGVYEVTTGAAVYFSPLFDTADRPTFNYALAVVDFGYMLTKVREWGVVRGNVEVVGELFAGGVFVGNGNYLVGSTAWMRYNFIQPNWKLVPYFQLGWGICAADFDQSYFGQVFGFNMGGALGLRYFLRPDIALTVEYRIHHISNADMADNNIGIDTQGGMFGISWFF